MDDLFNIKGLSKIDPAKGTVLISEPLLDDQYFKRSVVLLCEHNNEGSFGFVLNKYVDFTLSEVVEGLPDVSTKISIGGPVQTNNLYYIHTIGERLEGSLEVLPGLFMGGDFDQMKELLSTGQIDPEDIRFFIGYSGWSPDQLNKELEDHSWIVARANKELLMSTNEEYLWKSILKSMGGKYARLTNYPEDPSLN